MRVFIYGCILLGIEASFVALATQEPEKKRDPQVVASQKSTDPNFKKLDEISGIALAGFRDENGHPLLWAHNEKVSHIVLLATAQGKTLYVGALQMPGRKTRDAEDIATVHDQGKGTIYLEDAGANRKDMPACIRYARKKDNPSQCTVADSMVLHVDKKSAAELQKNKEECLARGSDWIWLEETDYLDPGVHPAIRRIPEPTYAQVMRGKLAMDTEIVEFEYPEKCGDKACRKLPGNKMSDIAHAYNTESLAVVVEPDHSHTAYLFTKAPLSLAPHLKKQHPEAAACEFDSDGLSDVFRIRHLDTLPPEGLHQAEYVTTLTLAAYEGAAHNRRSYRVTSANFLQMSKSQGLLLLRTNGSAYKWPVTLGRDQLFDVAGALRTIPPLLAAIPTKDKMAGVNKKNQEAVAQLDESTIYYMGECKGLPACSVTMVHDNHHYLAGDVDGNGNIDAQDISALEKFLAGEGSLYCRAAADVNGDNTITAADVEYLRQYVAGKGPAPVQQQGRGSGALSCGYYAVAGKKPGGIIAAP